MSVPAIDPLSAQLVAARGHGGARFVRMLHEAAAPGARGADAAAKIHKAATGLLSQALVMPVLKELRGGSLAWGPFKPGDGERTFGPMLDQRIADRIAGSERVALGRRLEESLMRRRGVIA